MNIGEVVATLKVRDQDFTAGMDRAAAATKKLETASSRLHDQMTRQANTMAVVAGVAMVAFGRAALSAAVDAEEAASAFATSFGPAADTAGRFVEEFANKAGMANYQLQQMMAVTGSVVQGLGATEAESAALAERMVTLAGDVASFSNAQGGAQAVMLALQSAINGEREALKTYGLALSEAEVQQKAFEMTGKDSVAELTRMDKALATVELAYTKASKAVGDLDRTQNSSANQLRQMRAGFEELKVSVGNALVPIVGGLIPAFKGIMDFAAKVPALTTGLGTAVVVVGGAAAAAKMLKLELSAARMAALGLVGAVAGLALFGVGQRTIMDDWRDALEELAPAIVEGGEAVEAMRDRLVELGFSARDIDPLIRRMRDELPDALDTVGEAIDTAVRDLFPDWMAALDDAADAAQQAADDEAALTDEIQGQHRALERLISSEERIADLRRAAIDPLFAVVDATGQLRQAQTDLADAMATGDLQAAADATERLYGAQLDLNAASGALNMDTAVAQLSNVLEQAGLTADEIAQIVANIRILNGTTIDDKWFTVHAQVAAAAASAAGYGGQALNWATQMVTGGGMQERASGGPVFPGGAAIVGEAGPELLTVSGRGAMVTPLDKIPKLQGGGKVEALNPRDPATWGGYTDTVYEGTAGKVEAVSGWGNLTAMQAAVFERMGWALPDLTRRVEALAAAPRASGVGNVINVYVTVEGSIRSDKELAKVVEAELVRAVRRGGASEILS